MKRTEYDRLALEARNERARSIEAAKRRYRQVMQALKVVLELSQGTGEGRTAPGGRPRRGELSAAVRAAIPKMASQFTAKDIVANVENSGLRAKSSSVVSVLRRMAQTGKLVEVKKGAGRSASIFSRSNADDVKTKQEA